QYMLEVGNRATKLEGKTIDLNQYSGDVKLIIQFSNLKLGLNNSFTDVRNSDHPRFFYMEASQVKTNNVLLPAGDGMVKLSATGGNYGPTSNKLVYTIGSVSSKATVRLVARAEIVDGIYNRKWRAVNINENFTFLPKKVSLETLTWRQISSLWNTLQENPDAGDPAALLEKCAEYRKGCANEEFTCRYEEDVLYYTIALSAGRERKTLIGEYREKYRKGKYLETIEQLPEPHEPEIPIEKESARIDFDDNYVIVNGIKGGKQPYYIKFYDYEKNEKYPLESRRFNKSGTQLALAFVPVPEGFYTVKITDAKDNVFIQEDKVYVREAFALPPSVKLGGILLFLGGLAFVYKKYIYF
ncbi:MAG: hypothetical protein KDD04_10040, partial [Sinomicrobium sp.]|nr:hypothetical protein [Sinomicrobium sp.]